MAVQPKKMEWTEEVVAQLRKWWDEGLSTAEIGRKLNMTKNAVVGKAHRLKLPSRPSPIKRGKKKVEGATNATEKKAAPKAKKATAAKAEKVKEPKAAAPAKKKTTRVSKKQLAEQQERDMANFSIEDALSALTVQTKVVKAKQKAEEAKQKRKSAKISSACQWPMGDPSQPDFHYCEAEVFEGKPYCLEHCAVAYVRLRERR